MYTYIHVKHLEKEKKKKKTREREREKSRKICIGLFLLNFALFSGSNHGMKYE